LVVAVSVALSLLHAAATSPKASIDAPNFLEIFIGSP
jgi:hypothetical protein